jgi:uncharacterized protein
MTGTVVVEPAASTVERIGSLDALRGIALLGMFLVHFNDGAISADQEGGISAVYQKAVGLFFEERFWTIFGILFGAGFAVQLQRVEGRGLRFAPMYIRRLLALAFVGAFTHAVFGYHVLLEYAMWGLPLLFLRRWSIRALVLALLLSAVSGTIYWSTRAGDQAARDVASAQAFRAANQQAQHATDYRTVFKARLQHMSWFYRQWYSFLPVNTLTLFLIGVIAFRLGVFERPEEHQRLIVGAIAFGVASWIVAALTPLGPLFGIIREMWLAFAYIGVVLLLIARDRAWLGRLAFFGWAGRMALTNYVVQVAMLDLLFSPYALGARLTPLQSLAMGIALFAIDVAISRWWLRRFRFGPLEWLWRWATYLDRPQMGLAT